jgi:hypothetical protein
MLKGNWQGNLKCCFRDKEESAQHLFLNCPSAKMMDTRLTLRMASLSPSLKVFHYGKKHSW